MGEDHQQQRARVAPPRKMLGSPARRLLPAGLRTVQRPPFSPDFGSSNCTKRSKSLTPRPETAPWSGELGPPQRRCARVARDALPPSHKPPLPAVGLSNPPKLQSPGGGPCPDRRMNWWHHQWNFPLGRGHCTLGLVLTGKKKKKLNATGKFFFSGFVYFC